MGIVLLIFLIVGSVSAEDSNDVISSDDSSDDLISDNLGNDVLNADEADVDDGNFAALDSAIQNVDAGGTVHLNQNVTLNGGTSDEETTYVNGITISKDVTINGYDQTINATDANGNKVRVFTIGSGAHVTLKDMTITGASYVGGGNQIGGAITVNGGYLTLINVNFINNYAQMTANTKIGSAAVMVYGGGTVNVTGGSFVNNTLKHDQAPNSAGGGAAINANQGGSSIYVDGTYFENNEAIFAKTSNQAGGGAIASLNSFVSISNSEFVNNRLTCSASNALAGAVYAIPNTRSSMIVNTTFRDNSAHSVSALYFRGTDYVVTGCLFENNSADNSISAQFESGGEIHHNAFVGEKISKNQYVNENKDYNWAYNWWGSNEPADVGVELTNWVVMTMEHDDTHVVAKLTALNDGTPLSNLELLPEMDATITGLGETRKVKIVNGVGTLTLDESITKFAGNTVIVTVNDQSFSFVVNDETKGFASLESNIQNTAANGTYDVKGTFQLNVGGAGEEVTYAEGIVIDKNITIDGHGLTINATDANGNKVRIFKITNGATVTLKDIILSGASAGNGGAIFVDDGTLNLIGVTLTENTATNGAAVYSVDGIVKAINSTFANNAATSSAALYIEKGTVEGCIFEGNSAVAVTLGNDAIANYNIFLDGQTVSGTGNFDYNWWKTNTPENVGVTLNNWIVLSISNDDTLIKVELNKLNSGDNAPNPEKLPSIPIEINWDGNVNVVYLKNGLAAIEFDKTVTYDSNYNVTVRIYDLELNYTLKPIESDFNNFAQLDSKIKDANENDVIDLEKGIKLNDVNINEETTYKNGIVIDKSISIDGHGLTINATDANGNKVRIFNIANADVTLKNMILTSGSVASPGGAAIYINGGSLTLINVTVIDHKVTAFTGAALSANNAQITVVNSSFINNTLTKTDYNSLGGGAAIYLNGGSLDVNNSLFEGNVYNGYSYSSSSVGGGGGAIYTTTATTNIMNSRFIRNSAIRTGGNGELVAGALLIKTGILKGNIFEENTATSAPNTMRVTDADAIVNYNAFVGTVAQTVGGSANYQTNWWGTNTPASVGVTLSNWLVLSYAIDGNNVSATINTLNDGSPVEEPNFIAIRQANISIDGVSDIVNTKNGLATILLGNVLSIGDSYPATATIDSQTISFTVKPSIDELSGNVVSNATVGVNGTISVKLTGIEGVAPTGTVSVWLDSTLYTINLEDNGVGSIDLGYNLEGGEYNVYIKYNGDENYTDSGIVKLDSLFKVEKLNPTITLDNDTVYRGIDTYIFINVLNDFTTPTGEITVTINGNDLTKVLVNGRNFFPVGGDISIGSNEIVIKYSGDNKFNNVTTNLYLNVPKFDVDVTAELARDTIDEGNNVTMTVTVTPEGVVYYYDKPLFSIDKTSTSTSSLVKVSTSSTYANWVTTSIVSNGVKISSQSYLRNDAAIIFPEAGSQFEFKYVSSTNFRLYAFTSKSWSNNIGYLSHSGSTYTFWGKSGSTKFEGFAAPKNGDIFKITIENRQMTFYVNGNVLGSVSVTADNLYFGFYTKQASTTIVDDVKISKVGQEPVKGTYVPTFVQSGEITVKIGNIEKTVQLNGGKVSFDIGDSLTKGNYTAEIKYSGDDNYFNASTTSPQLTVKRMEMPTIEIENPETCELGKNITVSVNVSGLDEEPITGKFNVTIGDIVYTAYAENGKLTFDIGYNLTAGNHTINVYYDGDANYLFASKNASFIINTVDTTLDVTGGATILVGNDNIISIKVNPVNGVIPTGNVIIVSKGINKTVTLDENGEATYNIGADLTGGVHDVYVEYNGDVNFNKLNTTIESMYTIVNVLYVDADEGDDENGTGFAEKPFKSIKKAVSLLKGNGTIVLNGLFTGSDNVGLTYSSSKMIDVDIIGNGAVIDAEMPGTSLFTFNKVNVRFINVTFNNLSSISTTYGCLVNVADADYLDFINSTVNNIFVQNGKSGAIYLQDYDVKLTISNSKFDNLVSYGRFGLISTNSVNQGLSNARNEIFIDNSSFSNFLAYSNMLIESSRGFGAGASAVVTNSIFINMKGTQATYSSFVQSKSLNMSNCILSDLDFNTRWTWIDIGEGNLDYNFWSSNDPDFSHISVKPNNWIVMTWDNESTVFTVTLNTLNDGSAYDNITSLDIPVAFSDNLNSSADKLDENGVANATLEKQLKVGEKVSATIGSLTMSLSFKQDIENISSGVDNAVRWENGTITINVTGRDDVIPTGNVTIWVNAVPYTVNLTDGVATLNVGDDLTVGNYISKTQYNGDENYYGSDVIEFVFNVEKANINISTVAKSIEYGQKQVITLALSSNKATGNFTVLINNKPYTVYVNNPELDLGILNAGEYEVDVTYNGDENFNVANNKTSFTISKKSIAPLINFNETIKVGENQTIELIFSEYDEDAAVKLEINGNIKVQPISEGKAVFIISDLKENVYPFNVTYEGTNYAMGAISQVFEVSKTSLEISARSINASAGNNVSIIISGIPEDATGIVVVSVDGTSYGASLVDGEYVAVIPALKVGKNTASVTFKGDEKYEPASTSVDFSVAELNVTVKVDVEAEITKDSAIIISAPDATGEMTVIVDDEVKTIPIIDGNASYSLENVSYGEHSLVVIYNGVVSHVGSFVIDKLDANISASAEPIYDGDVAQIIVTVNETANGSVVVDGKYYGEIDGGIAVVSIPDLANGTYVFSVKYSGDGVFAEDETTVTVVVNEIVPADAGLSASAEPIHVGDVAQIIVTVNETAEGSVVVDGKYYGEIDGGIAVISIPDLANGTYVFSVKYSGDDVFAEDETTVTVVVDKFEITPEISVESIELGEEAFIEVTVSGATGSVTFYVDGQDPETVGLENGYANIWVFDLTNGTYNVKVVYSGDDTYYGSEATAEFEVSYEIDIDGDSVYGEDSIIMINLPDGATGNVTVTIGNETFKASVEDGFAYVNASALDYGSHEITVSYSGDDKYPAKTVSSEINVEANIDIPDEIPYNGGEISIKLPSDATGNVTVTIDDNETVVVPVVNGTANIPLGNLSMGEHEISAVYSGDKKYAASGSSSDVVVTPDIGVPDELTTGDNVVSIDLPSDAGGNLTVNVDGNEITVPVVNGTASVPISNLTAGEHDISVKYSGDGKYDSFTKDMSANVAKATPSSSVNNPGTITAGKASSVNITLPADATGIVLVDVDGNKYYANVQNGVAKVDIAGLTAGDKQLTYNYLGDSKYNASTGSTTLKVVSEPVPPVKDKIVLTSKNVKVKKSAKKLVLKATLKVNGKAVKGKKITFKFKGKKYTAKTNKNGVAKVTIKKKVIKKLKKGKKYTVKITYLKKTISKEITVKK